MPSKLLHLDTISDEKTFFVLVMFIEAVLLIASTYYKLKILIKTFYSPTLKSLFEVNDSTEWVLSSQNIYNLVSLSRSPPIAQEIDPDRCIRVLPVRNRFLHYFFHSAIFIALCFLSRKTLLM